MERRFTKEITKEGVKLTHPSGVVQLLKPEDMEKIKAYLQGRKAHAEKNLAELQKDMDAVKAKAA